MRKSSFPGWELPGATNKILIPDIDIGISVSKRCESLMTEALEAQGRRSSQNRNDVIFDLFEDIASEKIVPKNDWGEEFELTQGKSLDNQIVTHSQLALHQAAFAVYIWERLMPRASYLHVHTKRYHSEARLRLVSDMVMAQEQCVRHLTAIKLLKNLQSRHYSKRASSGGNSKINRQASKSREKLLWAMVTGILHNNPDYVRRAKSFKQCVSHEIAEKIFEANREYQMMDLTDLGELKAEIHSFFVDREIAISGLNETVGGRRFSAQQLRVDFSECRSLMTAEMEKEAAFNLGCLSGVRVMFECAVRDKFGELSEEILRGLEIEETLEDYEFAFKKLLTVSTSEELVSAIS